jgi:pentatricopeptide repeat protein
MNEEPRLIIKVLHIFQRYLETNLQNISTQSLQTLNALLRVLCRLIDIDKAVELFLNKSVLNKITVVYSRVSPKTKC